MKTKKTNSMAHALVSPGKTPEKSSVAPTVSGRSTSVGVVEDDPGLRLSFTRLISHAAGLRCIGSWPEGKSALQEMPALKPDVVLMDINMPGMSGIECTARLKQLCPDTQVIMVTVYEDAENIFRALQAGACGYLLKRTASAGILSAINEVRAGGAPMTLQIARKVVHAFQQPAAPAVPKIELTPRESEILELISQGFADKEIADKLNISYWTVRVHVKHTYEKLHVRSRTEAMKLHISDKGFSVTVPREPVNG